MSNKNHSIFKYQNYVKFLRLIKKTGPLIKFGSVNSKSHGFLLRHDVDTDLKQALKLSLLEKKENVKCTYFLLLTSQTYNLLSKDNRQIVKQIIQNGHEIGLHFDTSMYPHYNEGLKKEISILSDICNTKIKSVSLHNPSVTKKYPIFKNLVNAYDPKLFSDKTYISDSRMDFRGKNLKDFLKNYDGENLIQILLHPMHYTAKSENYRGIAIISIRNFINDYHEQLKLNKSYLKDVGKNFPKILSKKVK